MSKELEGMLAGDMAQEPAKRVGVDERLRTTAAELQTLMAKKYKLEAELTEANKAINALQFTKLPELMREAKTDKFGMPNWPGGAADLVEEPFYKAVLPSEEKQADKRNKAITWLVDNNPDILVTELTVTLGKGELEYLDEVMEAINAGLKKAKLKKNVMAKQTVHWMTLTKYVKEATEKGKTLPLEILGATIGRIAKVVMR